LNLNDLSESIDNLTILDPNDNNSIRLNTQIVIDLIDQNNEGITETTIFDPDIFSYWEGQQFSIENNIIYCTSNPYANSQSELCPTPNSFIDDNGLCNIMTYPNDPFLEHEITQNGHVITFYTWNQASGLPYDRVSGYKIDQIQSALYASEDWDSWRGNLYDMYPKNPTREYLEELFDNWY